MRRLLSRTSITVDEVVSILLGRSAGPIEFEPVDGSEESEANLPVFSLRDELEDELEVLAGEYDMAKHEGQPAPVVAEKLAALRQQETTIEQANVYLCAIEDELNKGEQSVLKVDRALTNDAHTFITLHSFNEWQKRRAAAIDDDRVPVSKEKKRPDKGIRQQDAILDAIRGQGVDPMALPPNPCGKPGIRAAVRKTLQKNSLFDSKSAFKGAWEDLSAQGLIAYQTRPSPKK